VPLRQYVLDMPHDLHHRLARDAALESQTLAIFLEELTGHLRATSDATGEPGFVTFIQRFGSTANLHEHFHVLAPDGVYVRGDDGTLRFERARPPTQEQLEALVSYTARRVRALTGSGDGDEVPAVVAPMFKLMGRSRRGDPQTQGAHRRVRRLQPACCDPLRGCGSGSHRALL
jgi:hypothetical protein